MTAPERPVDQPVRAPERRAPSPALDVLAVLAAQQQQLDELTDIVEAQQRTLQHLLDLLAAGKAAATNAKPPAGLRIPSGGQ